MKQNFLKDLKYWNKAEIKVNACVAHLLTKQGKPFTNVNLIVFDCSRWRNVSRENELNYDY